jgi:hypothetical protein
MKRPQMRAQIGITLRYWLSNNMGDFKAYKEHYKDKAWISLVTKEMWDYIQTDPLPVKQQRSLKHGNESLNSKNGSKRKYVRRAPYTPPAKLYLPIWQKGKSELGSSGLNALSEFVEVLNTKRKAKLEIVEYANPNVIEIREFN